MSLNNWSPIGIKPSSEHHWCCFCYVSCHLKLFKRFVQSLELFIWGNEDGSGLDVIPHICYIIQGCKKTTEWIVTYLNISVNIVRIKIFNCLVIIFAAMANHVFKRNLFSSLKTFMFKDSFVLVFANFAVKFIIAEFLCLTDRMVLTHMDQNFVLIGAMETTHDANCKLFWNLCCSMTTLLRNLTDDIRFQ